MAVAAVWGVSGMMDWRGPAAIGGALALAGLTAAALHDLAVRTVPDRLSAMIAAGALAQATAQHRLLPSLALLVCLFGLACALWARGWLGGGDAKLLGACAPMFAPSQAPDLLLAIAVAGGFLALPYVPGRRLFRRPAADRPTVLLSRLIRCERWRLFRRGPLPYALAIAAGVFLVLGREG